MPDYKAPVKDLKFVLNDVLGIGRLSQYPRFENVDDDLVSSLIETFGKLAENVIAPLNADAGREGARLGADGVIAPPGYVEAYREYAEGGWSALTCTPEHGGSDLPGILYTIVEEMLGGANLAFSMCPVMVQGAYPLINTYATDEIKARYLPRLVSGEWAASMSLTEAQSGSALGLLKTRAEPADEGTYRITGTKIFHSWGDHDLTENIVHLVLARLPDAPPGVKGISLFLVPKYLVNPDGTFGVRNSVVASSLEKKLGIHASPTCVTNFDDAVGDLIGKPNQGLQCMFVIMNAMRLGTGVASIGLSDAAYQNALAYTRERIAGRSLTGPKRPDLPGDPIIVFPDVRRMLMTMRAFVEGGRMFNFWVSLNLDLAQAHTDPTARAEHEAVVSLLTPVVKAFLSDRGSECADIAIQCFGGHGFIEDSGAEQYLRDVRFTRLAEGANGIQALDLIGRKTVGDDGKALGLYLA